jgi:hypothetical protein
MTSIYCNKEICDWDILKYIYKGYIQPLYKELPHIRAHMLHAEISTNLHSSVDPSVPAAGDI